MAHFQTEHQLFRTVQSTEQTSPVHETVDDVGLLYLPTKELESMIQYIMNNKTIPAALHEHLRLPSFSSTYPTSLIHDEMFCQRCTGNVPLSDPLLITSDRTKFLQIQELSMASIYGSNRDL